jgi:hypothetical protein
MTASYYPDATWLGNGASAGHYTSGPFRVVLHTTETAGLPSYNDGKSAPHLTYDPATRKWWQHTDLRLAARALVNSSAPGETNRQSPLQVEIICYSAKTIADASASRLWVGDLTDNNLQDLRTFILWSHLEFGVALRWPGRQALSYAAANKPGFRMTIADWQKFDGVCGHQHVPDGNVHWDPGALDWLRLMGPLMEDDMADPRLSDEDVAFLQSMRASTEKVGSNGTFPEFVVPWFRANKTIGDRVNALEATDQANTSSGIPYGATVRLEQA